MATSPDYIHASCPSCLTAFRVRAVLVGAHGVRARCRVCERAFDVHPHASIAPAAAVGGVAREVGAPDASRAAATVNGAKRPAAALVPVDCRGMRSPGPILAVASAALAAAGPTILEARANDRNFGTDLEAWSRSTGNPVLSIFAEAGVMVARVGVHGATLADIPSCGAQTMANALNTVEPPAPAWAQEPYASAAPPR